MGTIQAAILHNVPIKSGHLLVLASPSHVHLLNRPRLTGVQVCNNVVSCLVCMPAYRTTG